MRRDARWVAALRCGHDATAPGLEPRVGQWISCPAKGCRRQEPVTAIRPAAVVYVQETLL